MEQITAQDYLRRLQTAMEEAERAEEEINACCAYTSRLYGKGLPVLFDGEQVKTVLRLKDLDWRQAYHSFFLPQRGKVRTITAPSLPLKRRQRWILSTILSQLEPSPQAHGFVRGRSIRTNAEFHAHHSYVLCLDIQDFFPSIPQNAVEKVFREAGYSHSAAAALAEVCCYEGVLPQGAPTSPTLSNLVFRELDSQLAAEASCGGITYSRYADDLTFSANCDLGAFPDRVEELLRAQKFSLNREKVHLYGPGTPKRITGLVVQNGTVRVPKAFKRKLRQEIYYCRKFGVLTHLENVKAEKHIHYREYLYGKAYYIHMVEPEEGMRLLGELDKIRWPYF